MAWDVVSHTLNTVLPASKINQLQDNFSALAAQTSGAPVVTFPNSVLNANAGAGSTGVGSFGAVNASSGYRTTQPGCFGSVNAADVLPSAPVAGMYYKDTAIRAWAVCSANGSTFLIAGIADVTSLATGIYRVTLGTSFNAAHSWAAITALSHDGGGSVTCNPRSKTGGIVVVHTRNAAGADSAIGFTFLAVGS